MDSNLIEALVTWADSDEVIPPAFPGGVWNTFAATGPETPLPYLTFIQGESRQLNVLGTPKRWCQWQTVALEARSNAADLSIELGMLARDRIIDAPSALAWAGGFECGRYLGDGEGGEMEEGLGPDGSDVWVHRIPLIFMTARG